MPCNAKPSASAVRDSLKILLSGRILPNGLPRASDRLYLWATAGLSLGVCPDIGTFLSENGTKVEVTVTMKVRDAMTAAVSHVGPEDPVTVARQTLKRKGLEMLPVCHDGLLLGVITDGDIERLDSSQQITTTMLVKECMSVNPVDVDPDAEVGDVFDIMTRKQLRRLCVASEGRLVGVVTLGDLARLMERVPSGSE